MLKSTINPTYKNKEKLSIASLESIGREHLQYSNFTIFFYWDARDNFYKKVIFQQLLSVELSSYDLGKNLQENPAEYWIELKNLLKNNFSVES